MILETLGCIVVLTETLPFAVIVIVLDAAKPFARTLDTEMVLGIDC